MSLLTPAVDLLKLAISQPVGFRSFADTSAARQSIFNNVLTAAKEVEPIANERFTLRLSEPHYADERDYTLAEQKMAILQGQTLGRRLRGTWQLLDTATGKPVSQKKGTLATVPYLTPRGTFIHRGNEYTLGSQLRLRPGVFTRVKDNGEIEAHANVIPGKGPTHRYFLDPEKGIFYLRFEQSKIPILPLLRAMGANDRELRDAWGPELLAANYPHDDPASLQKLYSKVIRRAKAETSPDDKRKQIAEAFSRMELDPDVMQSTLGKGYKSLDKDTLLAVTRNLLAVHRGEKDADDRDSLSYQTLLGPEDLFAERIRKDAGGLRRTMLWKASFRGNLDSVPSSALNRQIQSALLSSGLGMALEEVNPGEIFDKQSRVSRMGEGGIGSYEAIPDEARSLQPSHLGFIDPVRSPESFRAGVDSSIASGVVKGSDGRVYAQFTNAKTGKKEYVSPQDLVGKTIAFPGEMKRTSKRVFAMRGGKMRPTLRGKVDYIAPSFENDFSALSNLVPMKSAVKGQRASMGARMLTQALALSNPEAPLVRGAMPDNPERSYEEEYGRHMGAVFADRGGRVTKVEPDQLTVKYNDGTTAKIDLYNNFALNRKSFIHNTPLLQPGERFEKGSLLARSNFTDSSGATALGLNARVAYLPFRGLNYEDATVISDSMAKRLTSEHAYQHDIEWTEDVKRGKRAFIGLFPSKFDKKKLETIDDGGVVRPGTVVQEGDPLILAARTRAQLKTKVHRKGQPGHLDESVLWEHSTPGIVTDVAGGDKGSTVVVKTFMPMQVGDKMSGRYGDKNIVSAIVPDAEMPHDKDGRPFEILLNELGTISRGNPAQAIEAALGKIAAKTGKPYKVRDYEDIEDLNEFAIYELARHGLPDSEDLVDPETGKKIPNILTGVRFFVKLHHMAEDKGQSRGTGAYSAEGIPTKGGDGAGGKRISLMDTNALLSHGSTAVPRDASAIRGQRDENYWLQFMQGYRPPAPRVPFMYEKFVNQLKASGINVVRKGQQTNIMALTDKDIDQLAGDRVIKNGKTVDWGADLSPIKGGLFDETLTGGHNQTRWARIDLDEAMPNPVMEEPIRKILGLTQNKFEDIMAGRDKLNERSGPDAIAHALNSINLDKALVVARAQIASGRKTARDEAVRKLGYLKSAKQLGIHPRDWVLHSAPVLPTAFRPVSLLAGTKTPIVSDPNFLYQELIDANDNLREIKKEVGDDGAGEERLALYKSFKAVTGLGDPLHPKLVEKGVSGILKSVFGSSPKLGTVQRKLISSMVDVVGRAVITPNPDLDMDHVGLPENMAWDLYKNFIVRRLKRKGMALVRAVKEVKDRTELARREMMAELEDRPVIINRAPVLHKFGILAAFPQLVKGNTLQISPLVTAGFNADFDGDTMQYHVPVDEDAKREAVERLLPSKSLLSPADFKTPVHKPSQEYLGGLFKATSAPSKRRPRTFRDSRDALAAWMRGEIEINDPLVILDWQRT